MKKLLLALGLMALLAGCASQDKGTSNQSMGGTSDQEFNNNATHGSGTSTATNAMPHSGPY